MNTNTMKLRYGPELHQIDWCFVIYWKLASDQATKIWLNLYIRHSLPKGHLDNLHCQYISLLIKMTIFKIRYRFVEENWFNRLFLAFPNIFLKMQWSFAIQTSLFSSINWSNRNFLLAFLTIWSKRIIQQISWSTPWQLFWMTNYQYLMCIWDQDNPRPLT